MQGDKDEGTALRMEGGRGRQRLKGRWTGFPKQLPWCVWLCSCFNRKLVETAIIAPLGHRHFAFLTSSQVMLIQGSTLSGKDPEYWNAVLCTL